MDLKAHILSAIKGTKISIKILLDRNIWKFNESEQVRRIKILHNYIIY